MSFVLDPIGDLLSGAADLIGDALETVGNVIEGVLNNPLPLIETVALTAALGPGGLAIATTEAGAYAVANAAVSAMNGGDIGKIALAAATSYAGGQIGGYTGNLASEMGLTDASLKQIITSSSAAASAAALSGKSLDEILAAGASGAIGTYVRQNLIEQGFTPEDFDTRAITNASTAAANAILSGKDVNLAIGNALAATTLSTAVNAAGSTVKAAYNELTSNTTKLGELNNQLYDAQTTASSYFKNTVDPLQQTAQEKYDTAMAAQNAYNEKYAQFQNEVNAYDAAVAANDVDAANAAAERANALVPDIEALATAYNSAADNYQTVAQQLSTIQNTYKGYTDKVADLNTQIDATNKVVAQNVRSTIDEIYNTTTTAAPAAIVESGVKSTLDTVMDANATALKNAQESGNSQLIQAVLDGNTGVITALANNDVPGAELAYKGYLDSLNIDYSQGDVNLDKLPTTPISTDGSTITTGTRVFTGGDATTGYGYDVVDKNGNLIYHYTSATPNLDGTTLQLQTGSNELPADGISGSGTSDSGNNTGTGSTQYPVVDNGDGTSSQVNPDGSITTFDNGTGVEISKELPSSTSYDEHLQEILNTLNQTTPTGPTGPAPTGPIAPTGTISPTGPTETAPTGPTETAPTGPTETAPTGNISPTGPIVAPTGPTEPVTGPTGPTETAPTGPTEPVTGPTGPTETAPTGPIAPTGPTGPTITPTGPIAPYPLGQVTNTDGSVTTTYSDGTTTTTPGTTTGTVSGTDSLTGGGTGTTTGGTDVLSGGTGTGTGAGTDTSGTGTGTGTSGTDGTGTTSGTGTTTTTGGTTSGLDAAAVAAAITAALKAASGSGTTSTGGTGAGLSSGANTLGGVALPEAKFVKGTQIASPLATSYNVPVYKTPQQSPDQGDVLENIQEAASGGLIQHFADGGDVFPAAPGLFRGRRSQFANPLGLSLTSLAPTTLSPLGHADGGQIEGHNPQFFSEGGLNSLENRYVTGDGDGTSDSVPAMLANGEFVIPADVVSSLGNGSNDAGAEVLDKFLVAIRNHKKQTDGKNLPPDSKGPLAYLLAANKKVRA